jgi:hypothetical protein
MAIVTVRAAGNRRATTSRDALLRVHPRAIQKRNAG